MAVWDKISSRGNVEDRRSMAPIALGGFSLTGLAFVIIFNLLSGANLGDVLGQLNTIAVQNQNITREEFQGNDDYEQFASTVLGSNNEMWNELFEQSGRTYNPPRLVLFREATQSACGGADSRVGPHYCPLDETIYLDETFFDELTSRFGAEGGDVAEAYVISHEVAHHVQNELGIMDQVTNLPRGGSQNEFSVKLELQADCFAGLWANSIKDLGVLTPGEIREAMNAAAAIGDDRIQERVSGRVDPESWTHGSSEQRVKWFTRGFKEGRFGACNTFESL